MFSGPLFADAYSLLSIQVIAVLLGLWAVLVMRIGNFNIVPIPVKNGVFITGGPYRLIRHPMYSSLLLFVIPELISDFSYLRLACSIALLITLLLKLSFEEKLLIKKFDEYAYYMSKTKRIIPFVY
jgi:protein-S-isoprenylcysteine O-methyltransferase Ste14